MAYELVDFAYRTKGGIFKRQIVALEDLSRYQSRYSGYETFASIFSYPAEILECADENWNGSKPSIAGYDGSVQALIGPVFDIDSDGHSDRSLTTTRELYQYFTDDLRIPEEDIGCYWSGHKGFHLYPSARIWGTNPGRNLHLAFRDLRDEIATQVRLSHPETIDHHGGSKASLLRLPGSPNFKSGLYKTQITPYELYSFSMDDIVDKAHERQNAFYFVDRTGLLFDSFSAVPRAVDLYNHVKRTVRDKQRHRPRTVPSSNGLCPAIRKMLDVGFPQGQRDESALRIVSALELSGIPEAGAQDVLLDWNLKNDQSGEPFSDRELLRMIDYVYRRRGYRYSCSDHLLDRFCPYSDKRHCDSTKTRQPGISNGPAADTETGR